MHLEERSGLGGDVDSGERSTLGEAHLEKHTWKTRERCAPDEGAFGGYDCQKRTQRIQRSSGLDRHGGHGKVSTVSLNQDEAMDMEGT